MKSQIDNGVKDKLMWQLDKHINYERMKPQNHEFRFLLICLIYCIYVLFGEICIIQYRGKVLDLNI